MGRGDVGGDDATPLRHQGGESADDVAQHTQAAVDRDDADEVPDLLAEAFLRQNRLGGGGGGLHVDQGRFQQAAEIGAAVDQPAKVFHLRHDGVERMVFIGMGIERGGVAIGEAAARCNGRSLRSHVGFHMLGRAAKGTWHSADEYQDRPAEPAQGV